MKRGGRSWLWLLLALPWLCLPLALREVRSQEAAPATPAPARPAAEPAPETAQKPAAQTPEAADAEPPAADTGDTEEKVSADNNLSFPVDI